MEKVMGACKDLLTDQRKYMSPIMFEALMLKDYQNNLVGVFTYFCKSYYFTYSFTRTSNIIVILD